MKVLVRKQPFQDWALEVTCNGIGWNNENAPCGSELEINVNDIYFRKWSKYPTEDGTDYGFICPVCGCFSVIKESELSENLKKMAQDYLLRKIDEEETT